MKNMDMKVRKEKFCQRPNRLKETIEPSKNSIGGKSERSGVRISEQHGDRDKLCFPNLGVKYQRQSVVLIGVSLS